MNRALTLYILRNNVLSRVTAFLLLYIGKNMHCMHFFIHFYVYQNLLLCKLLYIIKNCKLDVCKKIIGQIAKLSKLARRP